jgi:hypothetical protein
MRVCSRAHIWVFQGLDSGVEGSGFRVRERSYRSRVSRAACLYCLHQRHGCLKLPIMQSYLVLTDGLFNWLDVDDDEFVTWEEFSKVQCPLVLCWWFLSFVYTLPSWSLN